MIKLIFFLLIIAVFSVHAAPDVNSQIGVVDTNQTNSVCLAIQNADLKTGDTVSIVLPEKPQTVKTATVEKKLIEDCSRNAQNDGNISFYLLKLSKGNFESPVVGFGVIGSESIRPVKGIVKIDLNKDQKKESFRVCTSTEGLHLTVWTGQPLVGKRIWHSYYYLGYDVEPSCKKADYKE